VKMQVNRVIEDSEEDDCTTSPEQSPAKAATLSAEVDVDATIQASLLPGTGSTGKYGGKMYSNLKNNTNNASYRFGGFPGSL
jgi:hypothetical protein